MINSAVAMAASAAALATDRRLEELTTESELVRLANQNHTMCYLTKRIATA